MRQRICSLVAQQSKWSSFPRPGSEAAIFAQHWLCFPVRLFN